MTNDLKSSEALKAYARKVICGQNPTNSLIIRMFDEIIDNAPTVEAYPFEHGHWIDYSNDELDVREICSNCKSVEVVLARHNFCPNCGACMRKCGAECPYFDNGFCKRVLKKGGEEND